MTSSDVSDVIDNVLLQTTHHVTTRSPNALPGRLCTQRSYDEVEQFAKTVGNSSLVETV